MIEDFDHDYNALYFYILYYNNILILLHSGINFTSILYFLYEIS